LLQDGIASENPYAALVIPPLAEAAGVRHANPEIIWVGNDAVLDSFRADYSNGLYILEEKPKTDMSSIDSPGASYVQTAKMLLLLQQNHHYAYDTAALMRARLLDIIIGDWDRHGGQWAWEAETRGDKVVYVPIPRDRDQAFFKVDGWLYKIIAGKLFVRRLSDFGPEIDDLKGLVSNAKDFDKAFLMDIPLQRWKQTAVQMQLSLTDSVIEQAIHLWPKSLYDVTGRETEAGLKKRKQNLISYTEKYWNILNSYK
jgi:hypothetical protein